MAGTAFAVLATGLFGGIAARQSDQNAEARSTPRTRSDLPAMLGGAVRGSVPELEAQAKANPSAEVFSTLGLGYLQQVRATGDVGDYARAEIALKRARQLDRSSYSALVGLATLAAARHEFDLALRYSTQAERLQPASSDALGIKGDAQLELGRYDAAFVTFNRMVSIKPTLASYSRVAYGREVSGDRAGAIEGLSLAIDAGSSEPEHVAFALVHRGNLRLADRDEAAATLDYREALDRVPNYAPALAGQARIAVARGDVDGAVALLERAVAIIPLPEYAIRLSDILTGAGRASQAAEADRLVEAIAEVQRANGVEVDLELALFDLDRDQHVARSLAALESLYKTRKSSAVEDALAWALVRSDRCADALPHSAAALRHGMLDGAQLFHRAELERCLGRDAQARVWYRRALATDSGFSPLHVADVKRRAR